jgi:hypothetical protein
VKPGIRVTRNRTASELRKALPNGQAPCTELARHAKNRALENKLSGRNAGCDFRGSLLALAWKKANKKPIDTDKVIIGFWLNCFEGVKLKNTTEAKIYTTVSKMTNRAHYGNWLRST